jgi:hypothetical protein
MRRASINNSVISGKTGWGSEAAEAILVGDHAGEQFTHNGTHFSTSGFIPVNCKYLREIRPTKHGTAKGRKKIFAAIPLS